MTTRRILLVSRGVFHPPMRGRRSLAGAISRSAGVTCARIPSFERLAAIADLDGFDAMVVYLHARTISLGALERLDGFVRGGGGVLAIHSATASFKATPDYARILGGRFTGHGPVQSLDVRPVAGTDPQGPFPGLGAFTVRDEPYEHDLDPEAHVHFVAECEGKAPPMVWTRRHGEGRVCCVVPGHRSGTMRNAAYLVVLQRGLAWVCR